MKLYKILYLTILFSLFSFSGNAQLVLKLELISQNKEEIKIKLTSINTSGEDTVLFYTPTEDSFCATVIGINFDQVHSKKAHAYSPCDEILDLDHIVLDETNSVLINPGKSYSFEMNLEKERILPNLERGNYKMKAFLIYGYANFKSELSAKYLVYSETITSNELLLDNK